MNEGNLIRFKPGQSGNPAGRPKGRSLDSVMRRLLSEPGELEKIAASVVYHASHGNLTAARWLADLTNGQGPCKTEPTPKEAPADEDLADEELADEEEDEPEIPYPQFVTKRLHFEPPAP